MKSYQRDKPKDKKKSMAVNDRHSFFVAIENHSRIIQANTEEDRKRQKKTEEKRQSRRLKTDRRSESRRLKKTIRQKKTKQKTEDKAEDRKATSRNHKTQKRIGEKEK